MKKVQSVVGKQVARVAKGLAIVAAGSSSFCMLHQPKEPKNIDKLKKH